MGKIIMLISVHSQLKERRTKEPIKVAIQKAQELFVKDHKIERSGR